MLNKITHTCILSKSTKNSFCEGTLKDLWIHPSKTAKFILRSKRNTHQVQPYLHACSKKINQWLKHVFLWKRLHYGVNALTESTLVKCARHLTKYLQSWNFKTANSTFRIPSRHPEHNSRQSIATRFKACIWYFIGEAGKILEEGNPTENIMWGRKGGRGCILRWTNIPSKGEGVSNYS